MSSDVADQAALVGAKRQLRAAVLRRRAVRTPEQRASDDEARAVAVMAGLPDLLPDTVAAYLSVGDEPDTLRLVAWLAARGVRVLLPALTDAAGRRLPAPAWAAYEGPDALRPGPLGLLEPTGDARADGVADAGLVIAPGLAANRYGDRLGRGGGWYDRALAHAQPSAPVWLLLNTDEVLDVIPTQPWDRRVDRLVTPVGAIDCQRGRDVVSGP